MNTENIKNSKNWEKARETDNTQHFNSFMFKQNKKFLEKKRFQKDII
jgi:hypothetical protein